MMMWLFGVFVLISAVTSNSEEGLENLYTSTNGENWEDSENWMNENVTVCDWFGVACDDSENVIHLRLTSNGLNGTLPPEFFMNMTELRYLDLTGNRLIGSIPTEVGLLSALTELILQQNTLDSAIPSQIGQLSNLEDINLESNNLTGAIPSEMGLPLRLNQIYFGDNSLIGELPSELGQLLYLEELIIDSNSLSGSIPHELFSLSSLQNIDGSENHFSGVLPQWLCDVPVFSFEGSQFSCPLPTCCNGSSECGDQPCLSPSPSPEDTHPVVWVLLTAGIVLLIVGVVGVLHWKQLLCFKPEEEPWAHLGRETRTV